MTEDKMVGWHHWLNGHKFEQTLGDQKDGKPGVLPPMGSQRVGHDWATEQQQPQVIQDGVLSSEPEKREKSFAPVSNKTSQPCINWHSSVLWNSLVVSVSTIYNEEKFTESHQV